MTAPDRYAVWAPEPERVRLVVDDVEYPLTKGTDDWWSTDAVMPVVGARYGFRIGDDDAVRPDPGAGTSPRACTARPRSSTPLGSRGPTSRGPDARPAAP